MSIAAPLNVDSVALSRPDADTSLLDVNAVRTELANHHSLLQILFVKIV